MDNFIETMSLEERKEMHASVKKALLNEREETQNEKLLSEIDLKLSTLDEIYGL